MRERGNTEWGKSERHAGSCAIMDPVQHVTSLEKKRGDKEAWVHFKEFGLISLNMEVVVSPYVWTKAQPE